MPFAHNKGLRFRPDPDSVSGIAHQRRLGHLLSSALRHGSTRHIDPRFLAKRKQEAIGGAAGGAVFAGLHALSRGPSQEGPSLPEESEQDRMQREGTLPVPNESILSQIAARGGRLDAPAADATAAPAANAPMLNQDFEAMPQSGAQIVFDDAGNAVGWVPETPTAPTTAAASMPAAGINAPPATALPQPNPAAAANAPAPEASVAADVAPAMATSTAAATPAPAADIRVAAPDTRTRAAARTLATQGVDEQTAAALAPELARSLPADLPLEEFRERVLAEFQAAGGVLPGSVPKRHFEQAAAYEAAGYSAQDAATHAENSRAANQADVDAAHAQNARLRETLARPRVSMSRRQQHRPRSFPAPGYFIAQDTNQPIFPHHEVHGRSIPQDQDRDPGKLAARVGQTDPRTARGEPQRTNDGAEQSAGGQSDLQVIAVLEAASLQAGLGQITPKVGGEHDVFLDEEHGIAVKLTRPGELGADGGNLQGYLERLDRSNRLFHDRTQVMGWVQFPGEPAPRMVTAQPYHAADPKRPEPTQKEVDVYMRAHGFLKAYDGAYLHESQDLAASDAVPKNFVRTRDGRIYAVDVITVIPGGAQYDRLQAQVYNEAQVPLSALPQRGITEKDAQTGLGLLKQAAPSLGNKVRLVPSLSALNETDFHPDDWAKMRDTEGFYDPRNGETIVILDQIDVRDDESPARAAARVVLHERLGHAGLAALREGDAKATGKWNALVTALEADKDIAAEIAALREQGYDHLDDNGLVEEWFARQVETLTPQQLQALQPTSWLGKLWHWLQDTLRKITRRFNRADWTARELREMMARSKRALESGGPQGNAGAERIQQRTAMNPFHAGDTPTRTPNWLRSRLRIARNAPFRVQALGLRSILKGSPLPAELVPFVRQSERDIAAVRQSAAQLGVDLNAAITAYAKRANVPLESAHALVAQAMEFPAVLNALGDSVLKERVRRARNFLDDLSQATAAHTGGELGQAILQNRGHWMRRSYAAFDPAANWNYDSLSEAAKRGEKINGVSAKKILDEARSYIEHSVNARRAAQRQRGVAHNVAPVTPGEVEAMMRQLTDRNTWESNLLGNMGGSGISKA